MKERDRGGGKEGGREGGKDGGREGGREGGGRKNRERKGEWKDTEQARSQTFQMGGVEFSCVGDVACKIIYAHL